MANYLITTWPSPVDQTDTQRHAQTKRILSAAWRFIIKKGNERIASLSQVAAGLGLSVGEIRDAARTWKDTNVTFNRINEALKARLFEFMFAEEEKYCLAVRRSAQKAVEMDLEERQLEADNTKMIRTGTNTIINIVNYARPGMARRLGEPKGKPKAPSEKHIRKQDKRTGKDLQKPSPSGAKKKGTKKK